MNSDSDMEHTEDEMSQEESGEDEESAGEEIKTEDTVIIEIIGIFEGKFIVIVTFRNKSDPS